MLIHHTSLSCRRLTAAACFTVFSLVAAPTMATDGSAREFDRARPELERMHRLLDTELTRLLSGSAATMDATPSLEWLRLIDDPARQHARLDDRSIPLHVRLIERERRAMAATATWAATLQGHCGDPDFGPAELLNPGFRARLERVVQCRRLELDRMQAGVHALNRLRENSARELGLPAWQRDKLVAEARANTARQDEIIEGDLRVKRALLDSIDDVLRFMEAHNARLEDEQLSFDTAAEGTAARELLARLGAAAGNLP